LGFYSLPLIAAILRIAGTAGLMRSEGVAKISLLYFAIVFSRRYWPVEIDGYDFCKREAVVFRVSFDRKACFFKCKRRRTARKSGKQFDGAPLFDCASASRVGEAPHSWQKTENQAAGKSPEP